MQIGRSFRNHGYVRTLGKKQYSYASHSSITPATGILRKGISNAAAPDVITCFNAVFHDR